LNSNPLHDNRNQTKANFSKSNKCSKPLCHKGKINSVHCEMQYSTKYALANVAVDDPVLTILYIIILQK